MCFNNLPLDPSGGNCGHVNIIESINGDQVVLLDSDIFYPRRTVSLAKLIKAIELHGVKNGAGFWIISNTKN